MDLKIKCAFLVLIHMNIILEQKAPKSTLKFECKLCQYISSNKNHFNRHIDTDKHKKRQNNTNSYQNNTYLAQNAPKAQNENTVDNLYCDKKEQLDTHSCECGKSYKHKSNFYAHRKKCKSQEKENELMVYDEKNINYKEMFFKLIEKTDMIQNLFIEQNKTINDLIPKIGVGTSNNIMNISNSNNNTTNNNTNINLFLNENCKDALSIDEFVKKIEISLSDLLFTKQKGLVNGISNIFIRSLTELPEKKRPLWCSDKKRKKIFIKEDAWTEDVNNVKTKKAIKDVSFIQAKNVNKYTEKNPDWKDKDNKKDEYIGIVKHVTGEIVDKEGDVINKIVDVIYLDDGSKKLIE